MHKVMEGISSDYPSPFPAPSKSKVGRGQAQEGHVRKKEQSPSIVNSTSGP